MTSLVKDLEPRSDAHVTCAPQWSKARSLTETKLCRAAPALTDAILRSIHLG